MELRKDDHRLSGVQDQESAEERRGASSVRPSSAPACWMRTPPRAGPGSCRWPTSTRSGEVTGQVTIPINTEEELFRFLGNTIAGITPWIELCPRQWCGFEAPPSPAVAAVGTDRVARAALIGEAQRRDDADLAGTSKRTRHQAEGDIVGQEGRHVDSKAAGQEKAREPGRQREAEAEVQRRRLCHRPLPAKGW